MKCDAGPPPDPGRGTRVAGIFSGKWVQRPRRDARARDGKDLVRFNPDGKMRVGGYLMSELIALCGRKNG